MPVNARLLIVALCLPATIAFGQQPVVDLSGSWNDGYSRAEVTLELMAKKTDAFFNKPRLWSSTEVVTPRRRSLDRRRKP